MQILLIHHFLMIPSTSSLALMIFSLVTMKSGISPSQICRKKMKLPFRLPTISTSISTTQMMIWNRIKLEQMMTMLLLRVLSDAWNPAAHYSAMYSKNKFEISRPFSSQLTTSVSRVYELLSMYRSTVFTRQNIQLCTPCCRLFSLTSRHQLTVYPWLVTTSGKSLQILPNMTLSLREANSTLMGLGEVFFRFFISQIFFSQGAYLTAQKATCDIARSFNFSIWILVTEQKEKMKKAVFSRSLTSSLTIPMYRLSPNDDSPNISRKITSRTMDLSLRLVSCRPFSTFFTFLLRLALSISDFYSIPASIWPMKLAPDISNLLLPMLLGVLLMWLSMLLGLLLCRLLLSSRLLWLLGLLGLKLRVPEMKPSTCVKESYLRPRWAKMWLRYWQYLIIFLRSVSLKCVKISMRQTKLRVILIKIVKTRMKPATSSSTPITTQTVFLILVFWTFVVNLSSSFYSALVVRVWREGTTSFSCSWYEGQVESMRPPWLYQISMAFSQMRSIKSIWSNLKCSPQPY